MVDQGLSRDAAREALVMRRRRLLLGAAALLTPAAVLADESSLQRIRARGRLTVAVYQDLPPFHVDGRGIDVGIAQALARALGVPLALLPFQADENMGDDLRNMVWRGHYLGFGPADVLLHVPVDRPLMQDNPRVQIFAPYFRERVMIARDLQRVPHLASLDDLAGQRVAVPGQTLAGWLLIGTGGGRYREQLSTTWHDGAAAARALRDGDVAAAAGNASELESVLRGDARFAIEPLPLPRMREGWAIGCAVKREATDLAQALQEAMNELARSGALAEVFAKANVAWHQA
jgi:ABC-type amino acid transport substrate-binding protein